jgi:hypothetical protein
MNHGMPLEETVLIRLNPDKTRSGTAYIYNIQTSVKSVTTQKKTIVT